MDVWTLADGMHHDGLRLLPPVLLPLAERVIVHLHPLRRATTMTSVMLHLPAGTLSRRSYHAIDYSTLQTDGQTSTFLCPSGRSRALLTDSHGPRTELWSLSANLGMRITDQGRPAIVFSAASPALMTPQGCNSNAPCDSFVHTQQIRWLPTCKTCWRSCMEVTVRDLGSLDVRYLSTKHTPFYHDLLGGPCQQEIRFISCLKLERLSRRRRPSLVLSFSVCRPSNMVVQFPRRVRGPFGPSGPCFRTFSS
ncbi:hypothetical protein OH76DRAFT_832035 [Lentinus brumalis]|uniref:Uncharacterized protein n=1 Tax=Lentinus brumalis TaxID=2498619 RepID=A0A371D1V4_9APHY|nr:hypothetical protein OH76DRAFT_832035 [Polyporus brumalis]